MESNGATPLTVQVKVGGHNAVLWYEYESDLEGLDGELGKTIVKSKFEYILTEPVISNFFYKNDNLVTFLKSQIDPKAKRAVLYSKEGWKNRLRVKKELDKAAEPSSLFKCFARCGAVVCRGRCGKCDFKNTSKLNEDSYCSILAKENPGKTTKVAYELLGPAPVVVEAIER
jgi:hypothetical protein